MADDFRDRLPVADIQLGGRNYIRVYGDSGLTPPLVEMVEMRLGRMETVTNLMPAQAREIAVALAKAADKAESGSAAATQQRWTRDAKG